MPGPTPPPPGLNYLAVIEPGLTFSLLGAFLGGLLVPLLIFLFLFSTPAGRRRPVFIVSVGIVILGLAESVLNVGQEWLDLVKPDGGVPERLTLVNMALSDISPMIIDSILIFRLLAFYPRITTPRSTYFMVLALPVTVKIARFACVTTFLVKLGNTNGEDSIGTLATKVWYRNPFLTSEWSLQILDNLYSTSFFLWKLRKFYSGGDNSFRVRNKTLLAQLRGIFAIALANFVFPLFMNVTQLIFITIDRSYVRGTAVSMSNMYVSIFGALFATVWASGNAWGRNDSPNDQSAFQTTLSATPGYVGSGTDPRLAGSSKTKLSENSHYFSSKNQSGALASNRGVRVEKVTFTDIKAKDSRSSE